MDAATLGREERERRLGGFARLAEALREIVEQRHYQGFGDPASRGIYVKEIARRALAEVGEDDDS